MTIDTTVRIDGRALIGGDRVDAVSGETFITVNPATGAPLGEVAKSAPADVDRAVAAARAAYDSRTWSGLGAADRGADPRDSRSTVQTFAAADQPFTSCQITRFAEP